MYMKASQLTILTAALIFIGVHVHFAEAAKVTIAPLLVEVEMSQRDVVTRDILLTNQMDYKLVLFATVNEVALGTTGEIKEFITPSMTDQSATVTSWTEITRGRIEIEPHGTTTVPLTFRLSPYAKAGVYTEFIGFVPEANRDLAEAAAMRGDADGVMVKISVNQKNTNLLKIVSFLSKRFIFKDEDRQIKIELENGGDVETTPTGEIIFYNSRGGEVGSIKVNESNSSIAPHQRKTYVAEIPFNDKLGRFKANVRLDYGNGPQKSTIFDTTQFFMIPLVVLLILIALIVGLSLLITFFLLRTMRQGNRAANLEDNQLPLYIRNDREHETKDHDIHIQKN